MENKTNKTILLGITGSIAAYKMADVASSLTKDGLNVQTILTKNAQKLICPIVFSTLTNNKCITKTFDGSVNYNVAHISLAKQTDVVLIAPATANIIGKLANGIADDMLTTTVLACKCPKLIAPAMNTNMLDNPIVQENLNKLKSFGWVIIEPDEGVLACKDTGKGKLPKPDVLVQYIKKELITEKDLVGKNVLVTAGPTQEAIDPVRYITNHSSGKMGFKIAEAALCRGANVTLISGPSNEIEFPGVKRVNVTSAQDMFEEVKSRAANQDIIIKAAAVSDFTPVKKFNQKVKKEESLNNIELKKTQDILKYLGENKKDNQILCGFSMETQDLIENSTKKLKKKNLDLICANSINEKGSGFKEDTNKLTLITKDFIKPLKIMSKREAAELILNEIQKLKKPKATL